ncbi:MAG: TAXI family TRAP transporter solute-binding subunit [Chloroflexi bacterium]|nr:TAXI family TRAP transporter solute-binding subunit [Chloroflexota bacterium]
MKRNPHIFAVLLSLLVAVLLVLVSACGTGAGPSTSPKTDKPAASSSKPASQVSGKPMNITVVGGSVGGMWSAITEGVAEAIRRNAPAGSSITPKPGKDGPNSVSVATGEAELALSFNVTALAAIDGREPYKEKLPNVRGVAVLDVQYPFAFVTMASLPINSVQELKDKKYPIRIAVNTKGSTMELINKEILLAYGITYEDIEKWGGKVVFQPTKDALEMMKDGKLDGHPSNPAPGTALYVEAQQSMQLKLLSVTKEATATVMKKLGGLPVTLKKGEFNFVKEDLATFSGADMLITRAEIPEDDMYLITKALGGNIDYLKSVHKSLFELSPAFMANMGSVPVHPGAAKYYKEVGAVK